MLFVSGESSPRGDKVVTSSRGRSFEISSERTKKRPLSPSVHDVTNDVRREYLFVPPTERVNQSAAVSLRLRAQS